MGERDKEKVNSKHALELYIRFIPTPNTVRTTHKLAREGIAPPQVYFSLATIFRLVYVEELQVDKVTIKEFLIITTIGWCSPMLFKDIT